MRIVIIILLISTAACKRDNKGSDVAQPEVMESQVLDNPGNLPDHDTLDIPSEVYPVTFESPMRGIGVVVVKSPISRTNSVTLVNSDNTVFAELNYSKEFFQIKDKKFEVDAIDNKTLESVFGFKPRIFEVEYEIVHFECIARDNDFFEVLIDPEKGTTKRIRVDSTIYEFYAWEEYILNAYLLFDSKTNPLKEDPFDNSKVIYEYNDFYFKGIGVKGDWLKVECNSDCKACEKGDLTGWIKWREGNKFLVQLGFIC
jgi:hypothetical protein